MKTIKVELTEEQIKTENAAPIEIELGEMMICQPFNFRLVFPVVLFDTIEAKTFSWKSIKEENQEEK